MENMSYLCGELNDDNMDRLKQILKEKHISGSELARRMGVAPQYIHGAIRGDVSLSVKKCREVADILGIPLAALFDGYGEPDTIICPHCGERIHLKVD